MFRFAQKSKKIFSKNLCNLPIKANLIAGGDACAPGQTPPFYRFCTITLVTLITFVTLAFSIHLLLRYLKIRSPT